MKKILFPLILLIVGAGSGVGAGLFLFPPKDETIMADEACGETYMADDKNSGATEMENEDDKAIDRSREYARLNNQFVVPVVEDGRVAALVVLSLSLEVEIGGKDIVYSHEPKLRDAFLQVLFDHANLGGFEGSFTSSANMTALRSSLLSAAQNALGDKVSDVLIIDIVRQDV